MNSRIGGRSTRQDAFERVTGRRAVRGFISMNPYALAAILAALAGSHIYAYFLGRDHGNEKYLAYKSQVEAQQALLAEEAKRREEEQIRIHRDTADAWASALDHARRSPRLVTVRVPADCSASFVPALPSAGLRPDGAAPQPGLGAVVDASECEARLNNAVIDAAQVIHLQNFIQLQHEASK